jgi:hypothetical protein
MSHRAEAAVIPPSFLDDSRDRLNARIAEMANNNAMTSRTSLSGRALIEVWHTIPILAYRLSYSLTKRIDVLRADGPTAPILTYCGFVVTTIWVMVGWLFFRSMDPAQAWWMLSQLTHLRAYGAHSLHSNYYILTIGCPVSVYGSNIFQRVMANRDRFPALAKTRWVVEGAAYS